MKKVMLLLGAAALTPAAARAAEPPEKFDAKSIKQPRGGAPAKSYKKAQKVDGINLKQSTVRDDIGEGGSKGAAKFSPEIVRNKRGTGNVKFAPEITRGAQKVSPAMKVRPGQLNPPGGMVQKAQKYNRQE